MYKTTKVFETAKMPDFVVEWVGDLFRDTGQDTVDMYVFCESEMEEIAECPDIQQWFLDNGCVPGEHIIIEKGEWTENHNTTLDYLRDWRNKNSRNR